MLGSGLKEKKYNSAGAPNLPQTWGKYNTEDNLGTQGRRGTEKRKVRAVAPVLEQRRKNFFTIEKKKNLASNK